MDKIEVYWAIISYFSIYAVMFISGCCFYRFAKPFMENKKRAYLIGLTYFLTMLVLYVIPVIINNFIAYSIGNLAAFAVMYILDRRNVEQKIFITVTFFVLRWLSISMANSISVLYHFVLRTAYIIERPKLQLYVYAGITMLDVMLSFVFVGISVWSITKTYVYKKVNITKKELLILIMPSVTGMIEYVTLQYYGKFYERQVANGYLDTYNVLCFIHHAVLFITIAAVIILFQKIKEKQEEEKREKLFYGQVEDMKRHISEVEKLYQDIRGLKHEMNNHILILKELYTKNELEAANTYVLKLKEQMEEITSEMKTGNPITDVVLTEKKKEAEERKINFISEFYYPQETVIDVFDVCVILNNALDNAIEASKKCADSWIHIKSYQKKNVYMIEIENSCLENIVMNSESGLPVTTKQEKDYHGYGLLNIQKAAQRYFGDIDLEYEKGFFKICIMLMIQ